jgi:hypothetical protein
MYFARPVFPQPEKLDHEPLVSFFDLTALTSGGRFLFSKSIFTTSGRNREFLDMPFTSDTSENSLFLPEGVKIDFENAKRPSDVKAVKWKKDSRGS